MNKKRLFFGKKKKKKKKKLPAGLYQDINKFNDYYTGIFI